MPYESAFNVKLNSCYSCAVVFTLFPDSKLFIAVNCDVTRTKADDWYPVGFHHVSFGGNDTLRYSQVDCCGEFDCLAASHQRSDSGMTDLFPAGFQEHAPTSAGIIDRLPLLLSLAVFQLLKSVCKMFVTFATKCAWPKKMDTISLWQWL